MKPLFIGITAALLCASALGQGKLGFSNDTAHLIFFPPCTDCLAPVDQGKTVNGLPLAGSTLYTGIGSTVAALAGSPTFTAALYGGASPDSLSLRATTTIRDWYYAGQVAQVNVTFNDLPAGVPAWFRVQVYDNRATDAYHAWAAGEYAGVTPVFQATPDISAYLSISSTNAPVNSTWAAGTSAPVDYPGTLGALNVYSGLVIPEPPYVVVQPTSTTNAAGESVTFTAWVSGNHPMFYQWQANGTNLHDGPNISGSATNQLTLHSITLADAGSYRLRITNYWGNAASDVATLTVWVSPSISMITPQPEGAVILSLTGTPNSTNRLWVTASLIPPVQWSPVSTNVAGPDGTWQVTDSGTIGWPTRFYRASMP